MASKGMMAGMQGVFLVAAELSRRGFIVSTTSRNALGADLLVTDQGCKRTWSVQVKTNNKRARFWLTGKKAMTLHSPTHVYVFVNLHKSKPPQFVVAASEDVATSIKYSKSTTGSEWYEFHHSFPSDGSADSHGWDIFGEPTGKALEQASSET